MSQEYLGAVKVFAGSYAIKGYAFCQGQTMSIAQNTALFSLLGTTYGGNGISTFLLPNLQSVLPLGWGNGQGLTPRVIGETGGVDNVTLLSNAVPPHTHSFNASTAPPGSTPTAGTTVVLGSLGAVGGPNGTYYVPASAPGFKPEKLNVQAVGSIGSSLPHNNVQPSMGINYIIALSGIFPSRS